MNDWLRSHLVCPRDKQKLEFSQNQLICPQKHIYPVYKDIPVMLVDDIEVTHEYINRTLGEIVQARFTTKETRYCPNCTDTKGLDGYVQCVVPYSSGTMYFSIQHKLTRYPIPETRLPRSSGERLLDIGCNWGRWSIAAARKGYRPVGIDPSLDAILAARRVAQQLGIEADFIIGDARFLPFPDDTFDTVFSYSLFQHFSKENVRISLDEAARVLKPGGTTLIQMPNKYGVRQVYNRQRRGNTEGEGFEVRYWTPSELQETFEKKIGETKMTTDCYFGLGIQASDADMLPRRFKMVVHTSEILRRLSGVIKPLTKVADSVYLESINKKK